MEIDQAELDRREDEHLRARIEHHRIRGLEIEAELTQYRRATSAALAWVRSQRGEPPPVIAWELSSDLDLEIKSIDEDQRQLRGWASTPTVDRMGDVVDPLGCKFADEIPLLLHHDTAQVVGSAQLGEATARGIPFVANIAKILDPGPLKTRCDDAWQSVKSGLLRHVSIGFRPLAVERPERGRESDGRVFKAVEILELSIVPIPAQPDAKITSFKALDKKRAAPTLAETTVSPSLRAFLEKEFIDAIVSFQRSRKALDVKTAGGGKHPVQLTQIQYVVLRQLPQIAMTIAMSGATRIVRDFAASLFAEIATRDETIKQLSHRLDRHATHLARLEKFRKSLTPEESK